MLIVCDMADNSDINKPIMSPVYNGPDASGKAPGSQSSTTKPQTNAGGSSYNGPAVPGRSSANAKEAYIAEAVNMDPAYRKAVAAHQRRGGSADGLEALRGQLGQKYNNYWPNNLSDDQRAEHANRFVQSGAISSENGANTSRLDAMKARQTEPGANDRISDPAKIAEAQANRDAFVAQRRDAAVQGVKDQKIADGVNPDTNELVGKALFVQTPGGSMGTGFDQQIADSKKTENALRNTQTGMAGRGQLTMDRAKALTGGIQDEQSKQSDLQKQAGILSDPSTKIVTGEHGFVVASKGKLGSSGLANIASNPAMQEIAKNNGPTAVAALDSAKKFAAPIETPKPGGTSPGGQNTLIAQAEEKKKKQQPPV